MDERDPRSPYAFRIAPLPVERAAMVYAMLLVLASYAEMRIRGEALSELERYWPLAVMLGLPVALIALRLMSRLLADDRFLYAIAGVLAAAAGAAFVLMTPSAALSVLRSFNYGALLASIGLAGLARLLDRPWRRENRRWMVLNAALAAGAAAALALLHA